MLLTTCNKLNSIIRSVTSCSNKCDTVMIQQDVTRLTTQGCSNIVIIIVTALLEQPCNKSDNINKLATGC